MNIDNLIAFIKTAECKNMTQAANELFISQQALSRQIAVLENELGALLFIRGRKLQLTSTGEHCLSEAKEILDHYQHMLNYALEENKGIHGSIKIGYLDIFQPFVMQTLKDFTKISPNVKSISRTGSPEELSRQLREGMQDVIFVGKHSVPELRELSKFDVMENRLNLLVHSDSLYAKKSIVSLEEVSEEHFCFFERNDASDSIDYQIWLCRSSGFSPKITFRAHSLEDMQMFVSLGNGVAFSSTLQSLKMPYNENVKSIPVLQTQYDDYYYIACAYRNDPIKPALQSYLKIVHGLCKLDD